MRSARLFLMTIALAFAALTAAPPSLTAQDSTPLVDTFAVVDTALFGPVDTIAADTTHTVGGIPVPDTRSAINWLLTILMTIATPRIMTRMERLSTWLSSAAPEIKIIVVTAIPAVVMYVASVAAHFWPWFPWEPTLLNAVGAGVGALAVHAGTKAKAIAATKTTSG